MGVLLSKPNTEKVYEEDSSGPIKFAACSMQGWRTSMEDAHSCQLEFDGSKHSAFFGVFDGHAGTDVAIYSSRNLHKNILNTEAFKRKNFEQALKEGFLKTDSDLRTKEGIAECLAIRREVAKNKTQGDSDDEWESEDPDSGVTESGSTAVTCLIMGSTMYCANAGDSRAVLCRKGVALPLSDDHKPFNDLEKNRIERAGGFVEDKRVNGTLAVARAMGDFSFKTKGELSAEEQAVTCDPEIKKFTLEDGDDFIILACDGIWDVLSSQQACDLVSERLKKGSDLKCVLSDLFDSCLSPHPSANEGLGCDNMTAIIVTLNHK